MVSTGIIVLRYGQLGDTASARSQGARMRGIWVCMYLYCSFQFDIHRSRRRLHISMYTMLQYNASIFRCMQSSSLNYMWISWIPVLNFHVETLSCSRLVALTDAHIYKIYMYSYPYVLKQPSKAAVDMFNSFQITLHQLHSTDDQMVQAKICIPLKLLLSMFIQG